MDPIKVDFSKKDSAKKADIVIPPERAALKIILSILCSLVFAVVAFYVMLPAINLKAYELYLYLGIVAVSYIVFNALFANAFMKPEYMPYVKKRARIPGVIIGLLVVVVVIGFVVSSEFFRAKSYSEIISVETRSFTDEIEAEDINSFKEIPKLDNDSATQLANKALGDLAEKGYVSQFTASTQSTQINYNGTPVRVAPLQYASIIKWLYNTSEGLPGYVIINMADESTEFKEGTIKYSTAEYFNKKLSRHLRFEYPTYMFGDATFEINDAGTPYWICPILDKTIGLFGGTDVIGAILVDAATGECVEYDMEALRNDKSLQWIDRVYDSDLIVEQYNYYGKYRDGFWNSILGQKNVITSTQGYNYIAKDDDVWMYTGVTSVTSDSSITGFVLVNQRTKETQYYPVTGGTEASAQEAAQGRVKDLGYTATFPLIVNIDGQPTYFMSLKDASEIVQQYALINVNQYNKIGATSTDLSACLDNYRKSLTANGVQAEDAPVADETPDVPKAEVLTATGEVTEIRTAVKGGESYYYVKLALNESYFSVSASQAEEVVILNVGDSVTVTYTGEGSIISAESFKIN